MVGFNRAAKVESSSRSLYFLLWGLDRMTLCLLIFSDFAFGFGDCLPWNLHRFSAHIAPDVPVDRSHSSIK